MKRLLIDGKKISQAFAIKEFEICILNVHMLQALEEETQMWTEMVLTAKKKKELQL